MEAPILKRRKRIILSCVQCRRKKVKCDRIRPTCGACKKSFISCQFNNDSHHSNNNVVDTLQKKGFTNHDNYQKHNSISKPSSNPSTGSFQKFRITTHETSKLTYPNSFKKDTSVDGSRSSFSSPSNNNVQSKSREDIECGVKTKVDFYTDVLSIRYRSMKTSMLNAGPFSGITLLKKDFFGKILLNNMLKFKMKYIKHVKNTNSEMSSYFSTPAEKKSLMYSHTNSEFPQDINKDIQSWELLVDSPNDSDADKQLAKIISESLPPRSIIYIYIDRFFKHIYPFYPLMDELSFKQDTARLIDQFQEDDKSKPWEASEKVTISFQKKNDYLDVGSLLLVLKFAYLSVFHYEEMETPDHEVEKLKQYPLKDLSINLVKMCLNKYRFLKKTGLSLLIALYYFEVYETTGFEKFCEEYSGSSIFVGTLLYSGCSIGLHKDLLDNITLENFKKEDMRIVHLWRKAWYSIYDLSLTQSFKATALPGINDHFFNTRLPAYEYIIEESNCCDLTIEKSVIDSIRFKYELNTILVDLLSKVLNMKKLNTVEELEETLSRLEKYESDHFMNFESLISDFRYRKQNKLGKYGYVDSVKMERDFQVHMPLMEIIFIVKHAIFLELEKKGDNLSFDYFLQSLKYACEIIYIVNFWTEYGDEYVSDHAAYRFIFSANCLMTLLNLSIFICTFLMRIISIKYQLIYMEPQIERKVILKRCASLEKLYSEAINLLFTDAFLSEKYASDFHTATRVRVGIWFALVLMTDESTKFEKEMSEVLKSRLRHEDNAKNIFSDPANISCEFYKRIFTMLLNYKDTCDSLKCYMSIKKKATSTAGLTDTTNLSENQEITGSGYNVNEKNNDKGKRLPLSFRTILNPSDNACDAIPSEPVGDTTAVSDIINGTGNLSADDVARYWIFLAGDKHTSKARVANEKVHKMLGIYINEKKAKRAKKEKNKAEEANKDETTPIASVNHLSNLHRMHRSKLDRYSKGLTHIERSFAKIIPCPRDSSNFPDKGGESNGYPGKYQPAVFNNNTYFSDSAMKNSQTRDAGLTMFGSQEFEDQIKPDSISQLNNYTFSTGQKQLNGSVMRDSVSEELGNVSQSMKFPDDDTMMDNDLELEYFLKMNDDEIFGDMNLFSI